MVEWRSIATYTGLEGLIRDQGLTPIQLVIGGSTAFNLWTTTSDVDLFCIHTEENTVIEMYENDVASYLGLTHEATDPKIQLYSYPLSEILFFIDPLSQEYPARKYAKTWRVEHIFSHPRVFDDASMMDPVRTDFLAHGKAAIGNMFLMDANFVAPTDATSLDYTCSMNWFLWSVRAMLVGAHYLNNDEFISDTFALLAEQGIVVNEDFIRENRQISITVSESTYQNIYNRARTVLLDALAPYL